MRFATLAAIALVFAVGLGLALPIRADLAATGRAAEALAGAASPFRVAQAPFRAAYPEAAPAPSSRSASSGKSS